MINNYIKHRTIPKENIVDGQWKTSWKNNVILIKTKN